MVSRVRKTHLASIFFEDSLQVSLFAFLLSLLPSFPLQQGCLLILQLLLNLNKSTVISLVSMQSHQWITRLADLRRDALVMHLVS